MSNMTISYLKTAPAFAICIKNQSKTPVYMKKPTKSHYNQQSPVMRHIVRIHKKQIIQSHAKQTIDQEYVNKHCHGTCESKRRTVWRLRDIGGCERHPRNPLHT